MRLIQHIIKDKEKLEEMEMELLKIGYKNYLMFTIVINTGLSISDILKLKVIDLKNKTLINITDQNTNKINTFRINPMLKVEIDNFIKLMSDEDYLFQSGKKENQPINSVEAYRVLNIAASTVGLEEIDHHTLRKTFGYWHYKQHKNVALLQDLFNQSAPTITLRYIEINEDIKF